MIAALGSLLLALQPLTPVIQDRCDLVEVNHVYDADVKPVFVQVIFYDWCDAARRFQVRAWRMVKQPSQLPVKVAGGFRASWCEGGETMRSVTAKAFRETWTTFDPELAERDILPVDRRRELGARP